MSWASAPTPKVVATIVGLQDGAIVVTTDSTTLDSELYPGDHVTVRHADEVVTRHRVSAAFLNGSHVALSPAIATQAHGQPAELLHSEPLEGAHRLEECSGVGECDRVVGVCVCQSRYTGEACARCT